MSEERKPRLKLRKGAAEHYIREELERKGCVFVKMNWSKRKCHFIDPRGNLRVEFIRTQR